MCDKPVYNFGSISKNPKYFKTKDPTLDPHLTPIP